MENQIYKFIRESVKNALKTKLLESFAEKYENAVDTIEYFAYLKSNGEQLSSEQIEQLEEIVDFLKETDASDNPSIDDWLSIAEELLNRNNDRLNEALDKGTSFTLNGLEPEKAAKMFAAKYGVSPSDFVKGKGGTLVYSPKRSSKPKKEVVSKPEGMSVEDYKNKIVIPMNPELKDKENEVWVPVPNKERYFGGAADYSNYYEVSNMGRLRTINLSNAARSTISIGYDAPTRKAMQFHLNHESGMNTCPDVKYMVADAFLGEHDLENNMVIHIDGDYHNNRADNLKWVPRKKSRNNIEEMKLNENAATQCKNAIETIKHFVEKKRNGELLSKIDREQLIDVIKWLLSYGNHVKNYKTEEKINEWLKVAAKLLHDKNAFDLYEKKTSGIHINPENKGKFNATKKRTGKSTEELTHSKNPLTKKRAVFAQNAAKWNKGKTNESALEKRIREGIENFHQNQERPSWEEILKRINDAGVNQAIDKQQQNNSPENLADTYTFQIGKYTFNSAQHRLDGPNGSRYLRGRISDMLLMFCEHLNQTISTKSILQAIWGTDDYAALRNMNVYMVELKKLLADDPNIKLMTLRGIGYRLEVKTGVEEAKTNEKTNQMKKFFRDNNGELHCIYLYTINKRDTTIEYAECLDDNNHWLLGKYKYTNRPWQRFNYEKAIQNLIQQFPEEWQENASREVINQLSESVDSLYAEDYDEDYESILYDVINKCGWSVSNSYAVESKTTGQTGTRFELVNDENACGEEELKNRISQEIPEDRTVFSTGTNRYAPEIKRLSVVLLDAD